MGTLTVIGATPGTIPFSFGNPTVWIKRAWSDAWSYAPEFTLVSCGLHASSSAVDTIELTRRYGNVKQTYDSIFQRYEPVDRTGWWVKLMIFGDQGQTMQFIGQVDGSARELTGSDTDASGKQNWVASGGLRILQKLVISEAVVEDPTSLNTSTIGWIPAMNARDRRAILVGNRSDAPTGGNFFYGGKSVWTHKQYLYYIITNFIQTAAGPRWTVSGATDALDAMETTIKFPDTISAAEMLKHLIPTKYGVDFQIRPTDIGFEINIFSLSAEAFTFGGVTLPANPNIVHLYKSAQLDLVETKLAESTERRVDFVEVIGKRIVVCGSLQGAVGSETGGGGDQAPRVLVAGWLDTLETEYVNAGGETDPTEADKFRKQERYNSVYQLLVVKPEWDLNGGAWAIGCNDDGTIYANAPYQTVYRETLGWIPLKEGFDYTTDPPTDNSGGVDEPDVKPPLAFLYDFIPGDDDEGTAIPPDFVLAHQEGISVTHPHLGWGLNLNASPNHNMARGVWSPEQLDTTNFPDDVDEPRFFYGDTVITIAVESDQRLRVAYAMPPALAAGDGSVLTLEVPDAELWVMLPHTIVDIDPEGGLKQTGDGQRILRNDVDRLALVLAGAVTRYQNERCRGAFTFKGFFPWSFMLGSMLTVIQAGADVARIGAVVTSIEWILSPTPMTILKTGYA